MFTEQQKALVLQMVEQRLKNITFVRRISQETIEKSKEGRAMLEETLRKKLEDLKLEALNEKQAIDSAVEHAEKALFECEGEEAWLLELRKTIEESQQ